MAGRRFGRAPVARPGGFALPEIGDTGEQAGARVVLAGTGGDAHSVGLFVLREALQRHEFDVDFVGPQAALSEIYAAAAEADAVLVSNMDGHAAHYLEELPQPLRRSIWYLGGNPCLDDDERSVRQLEKLGFDRVFPRYVPTETVVAHLRADLSAFDRPPDAPLRQRAVRRRPCRRPADFHEDPLSQRDDVLGTWSTGAAAGDIGANASVLASRAALATTQRHAREDGRTLVHPRSGAAHVDAQHRIFSRLVAGGAEVLSFQIDSLTRNNRYAQLDGLLAEPTAPELNGFPAVNHGVGAMRTLTAAFRDIPFQVRHSTRDPRLLAETSLAAGVTAFEGGALCYNLPYYRDYQPEHSVAAWRYVDRLCGLYRKCFGVVIDREFFGTLTATLLPPSLAIAVDVLEALLAAEGGVASVSLGYAEQGNRVQDVAALRVLPRIATHYLGAAGHTHVEVSTVFHQFMGAFPLDPEQAKHMVLGSALTGRLGNATRLMVKTPVEAARIPPAEVNAHTTGLVRSVLTRAGDITLCADSLDAEERLIADEASSIIDAALDCHPELHRAVAESVHRGIIDVPFSPSVWNAGRTCAVRDRNGAVRWLETGNVPLPEDARAVNLAALRERVSSDGGDVWELVERDIRRIAHGDFRQWPLDADEPALELADLEVVGLV